MRDIRILDLSRVLAGPWATMQLADQGATVIKVEPPSGDETRGYGPHVQGVSTYYLSANRNKRSIVLDLKTGAGQEVLQALVLWADVLVQNFRPGVAERLGIGWEQLSLLRPDLVYVAIHGFGDDPTSPWTHRPGYDLVLQALGGAAAITGHADGPPTKSGTSSADLLTGLYATQAILVGLLHRERTGEGQRMVVNMMQVQASALAYHLTRFTVAGEESQRRGNTHAGLAPYRFFDCADGTLAVGCGNDAIWQRLREALDIPDRLDWRTNAGRLDDRDAVDKAVERALSALTVSEADELLASHGVPSGTVQGIREVAEHPAVQLVAPTHPVLGPIPMAAPAYRSVTARRDHSPPPTRDQHRAEILDLLGLGNEASRLEQGGAFGQPR